MKTTTLLSLSFLLFTFSATSAPNPVLDVAGKKLRSGINYKIIPATPGSSGGGITLLPTTLNTTCPRGAAQSRPHNHGLPLTFTPVNPKENVIRISTDLNVKFSGAASCRQSNVWKLEYNEVVKEYFVVVGGVEGNPGRETIDNWFKIEEIKDGYKLVFCPTVCNFCKVLCRDVGIFLDDKGTRRLALSDVPFAVIFER